MRTETTPKKSANVKPLLKAPPHNKFFQSNFEIRVQGFRLRISDYLSGFWTQDEFFAVSLHGISQFLQGFGSGGLEMVCRFP